MLLISILLLLLLSLIRIYPRDIKYKSNVPLIFFSIINLYIVVTVKA